MSSFKLTQMPKPLFSRFLSRVLSCSRPEPAGGNVGPAASARMRGVKIGSNIVHRGGSLLENEYPECVEIGHDVQISVRAVFLAHTRGAGRIIVEDGACIGPHVLVAC